MLTGFTQENKPNVDNPLGLRIKKNGRDYLIYADKDLKPNFKDYRKINYQIFFREIDFKEFIKLDNLEKEKDGKRYQLITIPGSVKKKYQGNAEKLAHGTIVYPRAGKSVSKEDYDHNFWIEVSIIENQTETEHYKYANDVFTGLLTAPFKYRLKLGTAPESLIDGDFNIAPFFGWKWRVSSSKPFYVSPFGFAGVTSLNFNSANNTKIIESDRLENGAGLTYGLGLSFRFGNVSPGIIIGWDKGFGDLGSGFQYNDKAWISFSVNYDFFKPEKSSEGKQD